MLTGRVTELLLQLASYVMSTFVHAVSQASLSALSFFPTLSMQAGNDSPGEGLRSGVAHIVAAALQTKGLIDQAQILQDLTSLDQIAGFFYLVAVCLAVASVAIFGNYRQGLYLLIGPALYIFMVAETTQTNGVIAKLGAYEIPNSVNRQSKFLRHIRAIGDDESTTVNVSLFFATFDGIVSEVMQQLTSLFLNTENREHLRIVGRERTLAHMLLGQPVTGVIPRMIARHQLECGHLMKHFYTAGKDTKDDVNVRLREQGDAQNAVSEAEQAWTRNTIVLGNADLEIKGFVKQLSGGGDDFNVREDLPTSCKQMWMWIMDSMQLVAKKAMEPDHYLGTQESVDISPKEQEIADAREHLEAAFEGAPAEDILAAFVYKSALLQTSHSALEQHTYGNSPMNAKLYRATYQDLPGAEARGGYIALKYFATSIPYIQGLLLYLLSIAFPFFAILLVMPGKATSFVMWCSLWVWVKSWDLGFALVLVAKDMFWHMLKYRNNTFDNAQFDLDDPFAVYAVILNNDPLATMNTYWELSHALTVAVPLLTAHFCLGATNVFEMFRGSIDESTNRFRGFETQSSRRDVANDIEISRRDQAHRFARGVAQATLNAAPRSMKSDGEGNPINPYGAQTIFGDSIGVDHRNRLLDKEHWSQLTGARQAQAMVSYQFAGAVMQMATPEFLDNMDAQLRQIESFESRANVGVSGNAKTYALPQGFNFNNMDAPVPQEVLQKAVENAESEGRSGAFERGRTYTWGQFVTADAQSRDERLVIPHIARSVPNMHAEVDKESLRQMFQTDDNPLIQRMNNGETVTWRDAYLQAHHDQRQHWNYLAATVGRRYMPDAQLAASSFSDAVVSAQAVGMLARTPLSGTDGKWAQAFDAPGMEFLLESMSGLVDGGSGIQVQPEKPGVGNAAEGNPGGGPTVGPN